MAYRADKATVDSVCSQMNIQHADSVQDYALYFARLPPTLARTATLTSVSTTKLTLTVTSLHGAQSTVNIPLNPPMSSLNDSRDRLIAMADEATEGLGGSRYKVKRWVPPGLVGGVVSTAVCFGYWSFYNGAVQFAKGGFVKEFVIRICLSHPR